MSLVEIKNISKSYQDGTEKRLILDDTGLSIEAGEFAAIVGPSGCGKTTFLTIAGLLLTPEFGEITIDGELVSGKNAKERTLIRRDKIGFIFQDHQLFPYLKGMDQLTSFQKSEAKKIVDLDEMIEDLDLKQVINNYPAKMSGGEKQRIAIVRAFSNDPAFILADEPTASLDSDRGAKVVEMISTQVKKHKKAALMVTHDESVLKYVDTIYHMSHGKLVKE